MKERYIAGYVYVGTAVRYLADARVGAAIFGNGMLEQNIEQFEVGLQEYGFHVTERVAHGLWTLRAEWLEEAEEQQGDDEWREQRSLTQSEQRTLERSANTARDTLIAEAEGMVAFIASDKRYTVKKLMGDVGSLMGERVFDSLPDLAQFDFVEGGKAIAYELPTAAAFHILRGTEAALRDFYAKVVKRNRIPEPRMWAAIISDLRGKRNAPPNLLLDNLNSLRAHFRNPTQHPEKVYDMDEVQDLLALSIDSINRMVRHIEGLA